MIITMAHFRTIEGFGRKPGFCSRGGREWFARNHLDWTAFVRDGIEADTLLATGDAFAVAIVEHAQRMEAGRG